MANKLMVLFSITTYAKDVPICGAAKLLNLGVLDGLWRGNAALMRALPRFRARCQRAYEPDSAVIPRAVRIGIRARQVYLNRFSTKWCGTQAGDDR